MCDRCEADREFLIQVEAKQRILDEIMLDGVDLLPWPIEVETGRVLAANPKGYLLVQQTYSC